MPSFVTSSGRTFPNGQGIPPQEAIYHQEARKGAGDALPCPAPRPRLRSRAGAGEWCRDRPPFVLRRSETFLNKMCLPGLAGSICQGRSVPVSIQDMTRKLFRRPDERRVGKEWVSTDRSRGVPTILKQK